MTAPHARLGFMKLNVPQMKPALAFWQNAFGFEVTMSFDEPAFIEHALALPGQESGPSLMLVCAKNGADVSVGPGHGPVGFFCDDIAASLARAAESGASILTDSFDAGGGVQVALLRSPQGHEIELVQLPAQPAA